MSTVCVPCIMLCITLYTSLLHLHNNLWKGIGFIIPTYLIVQVDPGLKPRSPVSDLRILPPYSHSLTSVTITTISEKILQGHLRMNWGHVLLHSRRIFFSICFINISINTSCKAVVNKHSCPDQTVFSSVVGS